MNTTRRSFLGALASLLAYGPLRSFAAASESSTLIYKLAVLAPDQDAAAKLGREYIEKVPDEAKAETLADLICGSSKGTRQQMIDAYPGIRRQMLNHLIDKDFESGHTVEIEGWILSRTESRLFALVAVSAPPAGGASSSLP